MPETDNKNFKCPACSRTHTGPVVECPHCGVIVGKVRQEEESQPQQDSVKLEEALLRIGRGLSDRLGPEAAPRPGGRLASWWRQAERLWRRRVTRKVRLGTVMILGLFLIVFLLFLLAVSYQ